MPDLDTTADMAVDVTPAMAHEPVSSSIVESPRRNGFTADTLVKIAGWLFFAIATTAAVMIWFHSQQSRQDERITGNEKAVIEIKGSINGVSDDVSDIEKDVDSIRTVQQTQDEKLDEILRALPDNGGP